MVETSAVPRERFALTGSVYVIALAFIGLPAMYVSYAFLAGIFNAFGMGAFVTSAAGFLLLVVAFLIGMWLTGATTERFLEYWTAN